MCDFHNLQIVHLYICIIGTWRTSSTCTSSAWASSVPAHRQLGHRQYLHIVNQYINNLGIVSTYISSTSTSSTWASSILVYRQLADRQLGHRQYLHIVNLSSTYSSWIIERKVSTAWLFSHVTITWILHEWQSSRSNR